MASVDGSDGKGKNTLANLLREVVEGHETAFHVTDKLVKNEDGMGVEERRLVIERRQLQPEPPPEPIRQETPPRAHTFYDPVQFTRYVSEVPLARSSQTTLFNRSSIGGATSDRTCNHSSAD